MRCRAAVVLAVVTAVGGLGGALAVPSASSAALLAHHVSLPAGRLPAKSAKMVCSSHTQKEVAQVLGVRATVTHPTWVSHLYTCHYVYRTGTIALSVKELNNKTQTTAYFNMLAQKMGDTGRLNGLAQGGFSTTNGSVVTRKDYKVLVVDVSQLPPRFGVPSTTSGDVAVTVADLIMGCWAGD